MTTAIRSLIFASAVALAIGAPATARAQANEADAYGDGYQAGTYGRIRSVDGGASIVRADGQTDQGDRSGVNAPIFPGDMLRTDGGQRVEVQLANGTIVRMDRGGELIFQSLPNPYAKYQDNTVLLLSAGSLRINATLRDKEEFRIDTRDASAYLLGDGEIRIDADGRGGTRVSSLRGVAEVVGNDNSVLVRGGTRTAVYAGSPPENPQSFSAFATDGFDRWCAARDASYRARDAYSADGTSREDVPAAVQPYYGELSANGTWATVPEYGAVWYPNGVGSGWQPYNNGYWSYGPGGYFWVSYEPWGWAPYHYGNWQWMAGYGWGWIPGPLFAGAWVSWSWGSLYLGWAPLDYWGRPGCAGGPYAYGYYGPGSWTFVDYDHVGYTNVNRYAVPIGRVGDDLRHSTVVSRAPRVDPRRFKGDDGARGRALREVSNDGSAHMKPVVGNGTPQRNLADVQDHLMKRSPRVGTAPARSVGVKTREPRGGAAAIVPGGGREAPVARPRRILEDPKNTQRMVVPSSGVGTSRPEARDGVRDLYQRMSRPRETREPSTAPSISRSSPHRSGADAQAAPQRGRASYAEPQRGQPQKTQPRAAPARPQAQPQRVQPQKTQPQRTQPRAEPARPQAPQRSSAQAPSRQQPRSAPQGRSAPQAQPKHGDKRR